MSRNPNHPRQIPGLPMWPVPLDPRTPHSSKRPHRRDCTVCKFHVTETENAQVDDATSLSSVEHARNSPTKLQMVLFSPLNSTTTHDRGETASVSYVSSRNLTRSIPCSRASKPVYKYEHGLLGELDRIDSHGNIEVKRRKEEVFKAFGKRLKGLERVVGGVA